MAMTQLKIEEGIKDRLTQMKVRMRMNKIMKANGKKIVTYSDVIDRMIVDLKDKYKEKEL